jgi:hypothetical protein
MSHKTLENIFVNLLIFNDTFLETAVFFCINFFFLPDNLVTFCSQFVLGKKQKFGKKSLNCQVKEKQKIHTKKNAQSSQIFFFVKKIVRAEDILSRAFFSCAPHPALVCKTPGLLLGLMPPLAQKLSERFVIQNLSTKLAMTFTQ